MGFEASHVRTWDLCSPYPLIVIESHKGHCRDFVLLVIKDVKARKEMLSNPQLL